MKKTYLTTIFYLLIINSFQLSFHLIKNKPNCFFIKGNTSYEFEYIVSGQGQQNVICTIDDDTNNLAHIQYQSEYQTNFTVKSNKGKICFYNRDGLQKQISFDFIESQDPIKSTLTQQRKQKTHQLLYHAYNEMNKVYRDQHFLMQRKNIHNQVLNSAQNKLFQITIIKALLIILVSLFQFFIIKRVIEGQFKIFDFKRDGQNEDQ